MQHNERWKHGITWLFLHLLCWAMYIFPVFVTSRHNLHRDPVLDELHILSPDNQDVNGDSTWTEIFSNDYWGRPMHSSSSHKSWRPLTVLSFRYGKGPAWIPDLEAHRFINILIHAATAEAVSVLAARFVRPPSFRIMVKLLFALHPTHVEVTANAANRGHLLAVLCSVAASDPQLPWLLFVLVVLVGYLSSETFLFQVVPSAVTLIAITHIRMRQRETASERNLREQFIQLLPQVLRRGGFLISSGLIYYGARYYFDTLSIPDGLIRPAENPFFILKGWDRVRSYAYVVALHVGKAWDFDWVGFSHEYGHECIRPIVEWDDTRLWIPLVVMVIYVGVGLVALFRPFSTFFWWYVVHVAWMTTLFPISGIVKVGTFVSDRIVVAASVSTCLCYGWLAWMWMQRSGSSKSSAYLSRTERRFLIGVVFLVMYRRVYNRSLEWMDSLSLLESSLKTCPRFAKAHLEISKIYSGLYPEQWNLTKSLLHISEAHKHDPTFCDVHYQYAHVTLQQHHYLKFEQHLVNALQCPFTMTGAMQLWQKYWPAVLEDSSSQDSGGSVAAARSRYESYIQIINNAIAEHENDESNRENQTKKRSSPFANWAGDEEL
ncbi:hypothetical protein FisN_16Lh079 [Fistulifera solaris]|uniref:DUF1736 domain-containing protein n=1 Tax=Fistulifera solaris TaxID=1519565 RepID=A0A1Z5KJN7_FISSO|nr:hypothetical protein FisN_16Lh079 [Fistulifera solaris]|eukprot:GAX26251.1 hypothetical protein FisN_16Lh079 [Fistulifera solaris]